MSVRTYDAGFDPYSECQTLTEAPGFTKWLTVQEPPTIIPPIELEKRMDAIEQKLNAVLVHLGIPFDEILVVKK